MWLKRPRVAFLPAARSVQGLHLEMKFMWHFTPSFLHELSRVFKSQSGMPLTAARPEGCGVPGGQKVLGAEWEGLRNTCCADPSAPSSAVPLASPTIRFTPGRGVRGISADQVCLSHLTRSPVPSGRLLAPVLLSPLTVGLCFLKKSAYCHLMGFASGVGCSRMPGPCGAPRKLKASFVVFTVDRKTHSKCDW